MMTLAEIFYAKDCRRTARIRPRRRRVVLKRRRKIFFEPLESRLLCRFDGPGGPPALPRALARRTGTYPDAAWGFLNKAPVPKRLAQNTVEQVFIYELSFTDMFAKELKASPLRELSDLEFTALV